MNDSMTVHQKVSELFLIPSKFDKKKSKIMSNFWRTVIRTGSVIDHGKLVFFLNYIWQIEICKLDTFWRWFWNSEIWEILLEQPILMKCILCAIYGPICKHARFFYGKNILNVTTVKLFPKIKIQCFLCFLCLFVPTFK